MNCPQSRGFPSKHWGGGGDFGAGLFLLTMQMLEKYQCIYTQFNAYLSHESSMFGFSLHCVYVYDSADVGDHILYLLEKKIF